MRENDMAKITSPPGISFPPNTYYLQREWVTADEASVLTEDRFLYVARFAESGEKAAMFGDCEAAFKHAQQYGGNLIWAH